MSICKRCCFQNASEPRPFDLREKNNRKNGENQRARDEYHAYHLSASRKRIYVNVPQDCSCERCVSREKNGQNCPAVSHARNVLCSEKLCPRCWYALRVATRPRGVRSRNPNCIRYGSYTSSMGSFSSEVAAARGRKPTGPPPNIA